MMSRNIRFNLQGIILNDISISVKFWMILSWAIKVVQLPVNFCGGSVFSSKLHL